MNWKHLTGSDSPTIRHASEWLEGYLADHPDLRLPRGRKGTCADEQLLADYRQAQRVMGMIEAAFPWADQWGQGEASAERPERSDKEAAPNTFGRFCLISEVGRGGCGVVYRALDPLLGRIVALKLPLPECFVSAALRERFEREARTVAHLSHPNLVPVYECGTVGLVTYIASAYCPGPTLKEWLANQKRPLPVDFAAALIGRLAATVDYVHGRGILHRDLKPGNVLLEPLMEPADEFSPWGESFFPYQPKLTDFGLAKVLSACADQTRSGTIIGTPSYMAPEQARGDSAAIDRRSDVYALGAVLYELLVGEPPIAGKLNPVTVRQILEGSFGRPRSLRSDIPRDLEAICLKSLELEPARRYQTAGELAADLRRFTSGHPVHARPSGPLRQGWKWSRRYPVVAGLTGTLFLTIVVALVLVVWQWRRAEMHRREAVAAFGEAQQAVRDFQSLLDDGDFTTSESRRLRRDMLERAVSYYDHFSGRGRTSTRLIADSADAHYQLAAVLLELGDQKEAEVHFLQARERWRQLLQERPYDVDLTYHSARCERFLGWIAHRSGDWPEARKHYRQAIDMLQQAPVRDRQIREELADGYLFLGNGHKAEHELDEAVECLQRSLELQPISADLDAEAIHRRADILDRLGDCRFLQGRYDEAVKRYQRSAELLDALIHHGKRLPWSAGDMSVAYYSLGLTYLAMGQAAKARGALKRAVGIQKRLVKDFPDETRFRADLADSFVAWGRAQQKDQDWNAAIRSFQQACWLRKLLATETPNRRTLTKAAAASKELATAALASGRVHEWLWATADHQWLRQQLQSLD